MEIWESNKVALYFDVMGSDKKQMEQFANIANHATAEKLLAFGGLMNQLTTDEKNFDSIVLIKRTRYLPEP